MTPLPPSGATIYVDPGCPWTWLTARWLLDAAAERDLSLRWRTCSLAVLNTGTPPAPGPDPGGAPSRKAVAGQALRVLQAAVAHGDEEAAGRFYVEFARRFHAPGAEPDLALVEEAAATAGVRPLLEAAADQALDDAIVGSLEEARRLGGPDIGSPVLVVDGADRGLFGPIVCPAPTGEQAGALWDLVVALSRVPGFFEVKHGRSGPPPEGAMAVACGA